MEGEVREVLVRLTEEREGSRTCDLVEDRAPRAAGSELVERVEVVGQVVEGGELVG